MEGCFSHLRHNSRVIVLELEKRKMPNANDCNSLVLPNLRDISLEDSNAAQTATCGLQELPKYCPSILLFY